MACAIGLSRILREDRATKDGLLLGTAVYGSVRTVVWKDGMGSNPMPPIRLPDMGPIYTGAPLNENSAEQSGLLR